MVNQSAVDSDLLGALPRLDPDLGGEEIHILFCHSPPPTIQDPLLETQPIMHGSFDGILHALAIQQFEYISAKKGTINTYFPNDISVPAALALVQNSLDEGRRGFAVMDIT